MNKLVVKILISFVISFLIFLIYLGSADFIIKPKVIESDFKVEENNKSDLIEIHNRPKYIFRIHSYFKNRNIFTQIIN